MEQQNIEVQYTVVESTRSILNREESKVQYGYIEVKYTVVESTRSILNREEPKVQYGYIVWW